MILDIILDIIRGGVIFYGGLEFTAQLQCFPGRSAAKRASPKCQQEEKQ